MANRSYLYTVDRIPDGSGAPLSLRAVSEWNWDVPLLHEILLAGSPRLCPSTIWAAPAQAIAGEFEAGVANLERVFARLPRTPEVERGIAEARAFLSDPATRGAYFLLEPAEVHALSDSAEEAQQELDGLVHGLRDPQAVIDFAAGYDLDKIDEVTGRGAWARTVYYEPGGAASDPAASQAPAPQQNGAQDQAPAPSGAAPAAQPVPATEQPPFAPPQYRQPAAAAGPGAPAQPATPYSFQPRPATGGVAWGLGFLAYIPIPFASVLIAGVVMMISGLSMRSRGPLAAANGRNAANWGLTLIVLTVVLVGATIVWGVSAGGGEGSGFFPFGIPLLIWVGVSVAHVVFVIMGLVRAGKGQVFRAPAIPFFGRS